MINKSLTLLDLFYFLSTGTDGQRRPQSSSSIVRFVVRLAQTGPGSAEEARNRSGADGGHVGLYRRETVSMELRGEQHHRSVRGHWSSLLLPGLCDQLPGQCGQEKNP